MIVALAVFVAGMLSIGLVLAARFADSLAWRGSLVALRLHIPASLTTEAVTEWLSSVSASTHPPRVSLLPLPPVALEIVSNRDGISHYLLVSTSAQAKLLSGLQAALPGARAELAPDYLNRRLGFRLAAEATITSQVRPLATERAEAASRALLAALQPVSRGCEIRYQLIMTSAGTPRRVPTPRSGHLGSAAWWWESTLPDDAEAVQALRHKQQAPWLHAVVRIGIAAPSETQARSLMRRVWPVLHTTNAPSVRVRRRLLPARVIAARLAGRSYPIAAWPVLLNAAEAVGFAGLPIGTTHVPGLVLGRSRQLPPSPVMPRRGLTVGLSNYPGLATRPLAFKTADRLRHSFILGPTGSGKSWLLAHLILQDIAAGRGVIAIDPKGDLVRDVLARIDVKHAERVVVIDASKRSRPIGFNVLARNENEEARELTVEAVLHVFKDIWSAFWGPRSDQIMRASLSTLVRGRAPDGTALTLCELVPLLTEPAFRRFVLSQAHIPESVRTFWQLYSSWGDGGLTQAINPVINKVEAFTGRTPIRLMLGQSAGLDFESVFRERKVILVSLAKGTLGDEAATLLGALLVAALWETARARVRIPAEQRHPVFAYIDEAAEIMRLPVALSDMLAQARGLGLGVIAATQLIAQVPESVKAALLGTVRTQLSFAVEHEDAVMLAKRFTPLTADDLKGLPTYEFALRPCLDGTTAAPVTGRTLPLSDPLRDPDELASASRERYGQARADVESSLRARVEVRGASHGGRFGREPTGGEA